MSKQSDKVLIDRRESILVLTINHYEKRNAIDSEVRAQLIASLQEADSDKTIRAVVITGVGSVFSSGGDLANMNVQTLAEGRARMKINAELIRLLIKMSKPVIAAVEGVAAGAGLSLALACDFIVSGKSARYVTSFGKVGLIPDLGMLYTLPKRINHSSVRRMLFLGDTIEATEAKAIGLIDFLVPTGSALTQALLQAERLAEQPPLPLMMMKTLFANGLEQLLDDEITLQAQLFLSADHLEGKKAFFEKRKPNFKGE